MTQTLLIADGDAELCAVYRIFFRRWGYDVATATDGLDCLRKLRQRRPDVLVLDLGLRWGGGDGVIAWLREDSVLAGLPVVLTATAGYPQDSAVTIEPPVVAYLPKPFALSVLFDCVQSAVIRRPRENRNHQRVYSELYLG